MKLKTKEKKEKSANEQTSPAFWRYPSKRISRKGLLKYYNKGRTLLPMCFLCFCILIALKELSFAG